MEYFFESRCSVYFRLAVVYRIEHEASVTAVLVQDLWHKQPRFHIQRPQVVLQVQRWQVARRVLQQGEQVLRISGHSLHSPYHYSLHLHYVTCDCQAPAHCHSCFDQRSSLLMLEQTAHDWDTLHERQPLLRQLRQLWQPQPLLQPLLHRAAQVEYERHQAQCRAVPMRPLFSLHVSLLQGSYSLQSSCPRPPSSKEVPFH